MNSLILLLAALLVVTALPAASEAACGLRLLGWRPLQNAAQRRDEGRGLFQKNGPAKRAVLGSV